MTISQSKTPSVGKTCEEVKLNRPLFGYRTPNPTSTTSALAKINNVKLTQTADNKPQAAATHKSRLPISVGMGRQMKTNSAAVNQKPSTTPGLVKQRLQFFNQQHHVTPRVTQPTAAKTPMTNSRLAALATPKNPATVVRTGSTAKRPVEFKPTVVPKTAPAAKSAQLLSKTPAVKRPLPHMIEKKISRTVDCAKSIKRRSIKFLNNVTFSTFSYFQLFTIFFLLFDKNLKVSLLNKTDHNNRQ